jgi:hypothetical protein
VSAQGFIGETEVQFSVVLGGRQPWEAVFSGRQLQKVRSWRRSDRAIRSASFQLSEGVQKCTMRSDS